MIPRMITGSIVGNDELNESNAANVGNETLQVKIRKRVSLAGSRTPLSRVTGGCTSRYTTRDLFVASLNESIRAFSPFSGVQARGTTPRMSPASLYGVA